MGLGSLAKNGCSYSNNFSTVLRTTRNSDIDTVVGAAETSGSDPLPKALGQQKLSLKTYINSNGELFTAIQVVGGPTVLQSAQGADLEKSSDQGSRKEGTINIAEIISGEEGISRSETLENSSLLVSAEQRRESISRESYIEGTSNV